jgi:hypothetical protein
MSFVRRPFLASKTDKAVLAQPVIFGAKPINATGGFDDIDAILAASSPGSFAITFATESLASLVVSFSSVSALTLAQIVDGINTAAAAVSIPAPLTAYAYEGVLKVVAKNTGYVAAEGTNAFIEVLPTAAGFTDLAPLVGLHVNPHPSARVTAGDLASSSPRALTQGNRPRSSFVARGEDRTSESVNRALHSLAKNLDSHQVQLVREVAVPVVLEIPEDSPRLKYDALTGAVTSIDLATGYLDDLDAVLETAIFVDLPADASLQQISQYFAVLDSEWNELLSLDKVVGIGTVAYLPSGGIVGGASTFNEDGSANLPLSTDDYPFYRNALGGESLKQSSVGVTEIIDGATIICSGATFVTNGVREGDIVELTGPVVVTPISNAGRYVVDTVVSETEIVVRHETDESLHLLNAQSGETLTVHSNGLFETSLYLWFEPHIPRVPAGGIRIILGMQNAFGRVPRDFLLVPAINSSEEVDGWVLRNLHRNLNFGGVYQGQGQDKGGGFFAEVTDRPVTLFATPAATTAASNRTSVDAAEVLEGNLLRASGYDASGTYDAFTLEDVGRAINFVISGTNYADWRITRWIDGRTVQIVPPLHQIGTVLPLGGGADNVSSWEIFDDLVTDYRAAISSVTESVRAGGFHHTKVNGSSVGSDLAFAHFEHVTKSALLDGTTVSNLDILTGSFASGGVITSVVNSASVSVNPDNLRTLYPITHHSTSARSANSHGAKTYVRVLTGLYAGLYEAYETRPNQLTIRNLDGTSPTFTGSHQFMLLNLRMGVGVPMFGGAAAGRAALSVFQEQDPAAASANDTVIGIRVGWAGTGAGILVTANDSEFSALDGGADDVSRGYAVDVNAFSPADGIHVAVASSETVDSTAVGLFVEASGFGNSSAFRLPDTDGADYTTGVRRSFAAGVIQRGTDPALVVAKGEDTAGGSHTPSAAAVFIRKSDGTEPAITGLGSAIETVGSIWVHGNPPDSDFGHALGGVYSEDVIAAGRMIYPMWGSNSDLHIGYHWDPSSSSYWAAPTTLGRPGIIRPANETDSDPIGDFTASDYTRFNLAHAGVLAVSSLGVGALPGPASSWVGCIVEVISTGERYAILAVESDGTDIFFALGGDVAITPAAGADFRLHGLRWHRSYIDIADWMQVGTYQALKTLDQLPLLSSDSNSLDERADSTVDRSGNSKTLSFVQWALTTDGAGIGAAEDYDPISAPLLFESSAWSGSAESPHHTTPWATYSNEPRPPFYADETVDTTASDFALTDIRKVGLGGALSYQPTHGGTLIVTRAATATVLRQRGRRYIWKDHLRLKIRLRAASGGTAAPVTVGLAMVTASGTTVASDSVSVVSFVSSGAVEIRSYEATLAVNGVVDRASSALQESRLDEELFLQITVPADPTTSTYMAFQEISVQHDTDPLKVSGPVLTSGHVAAHGFRFANAVKGYQTLGPADTKLLGGQDYGVNMGWQRDYDLSTSTSFTPPTSTYSMGMQELRGGPGLLRTVNSQTILGVKTTQQILSDTSGQPSPANAWTYGNNLRTLMLEPMPDASSEILKFSWGTAYEDADAAWVVLDSAHTADPLDTAVSEAFMEFLATCEKLASAAIRQYEDTEPRVVSRNEEFYVALVNAAYALRGECASIRETLSAGQGDLIESLINSIPEDRWIRPSVDMYRLFDIGVNSATITLYTAAFDPLWYALHGHLTVNSSWSVNDVDIPRDSFIPPGFVGFTMPVDAPHGSVLSEVSISLSMRPSSSTCWGIYKRAPEIFWKIGSGATFEEVSDVSQWEPNAGVLVELWRFNTLDTAFDQDDFARWNEHEPEFGFGEIIWSGEVDLPAVGDNADATNEVEEAWEYSAPFIGSSPLSVFARKEYFVKKRLHLPDEAISAAALRVDRRHFAYALVIRFIGGPRRTPNALGTGEVLPFNLSDAVGLTSVSPDSSFDFPVIVQPQYQPTTTTVSTLAEAVAFSFGKFGKAIAVGTSDPGPFVDGDTNWAHRAISTMYPPNVKFRGARIGWLTDRAGDKGWG